MYRNIRAILDNWDPFGSIRGHLGSIWGPVWDHFRIILGSILVPDGLEGPRGRLDHRAFKSYVFFRSKCHQQPYRLDDMASRCPICDIYRSRWRPAEGGGGGYTLTGINRHVRTPMRKRNSGKKINGPPPTPRVVPRSGNSAILVSGRSNNY